MNITEKEEKMIMKYYRRPKLGMLAFISIGIATAALGLLCIINDVVLNSYDFYLPGLFAYLILVTALLIYGFWALTSTSLALGKPAWRVLAERSMEAVGLNRQAVGPEASPKNVAKRLGIPLPSMTAAKLIVLIVPSLVLLDVFIPGFISSREHTKHNIQVAAEALNQLQSDLSPYFDNISIDDPEEYYSEYGYYCIVELGDSYASDYIYIDVENDGTISGITYNYYLKDMEMTNEEIVEDLNEQLKAMHEAVMHITLKTEKEDMLSFDPVIPEFEQQFLDGSLYKGIDFNDMTDAGLSVFCCFDTVEKEEFTEYILARITICLS